MKINYYSSTKLARITLTVVILDFNTTKRYQTMNFNVAKRYDDHPHHFYIEVTPTPLSTSGSATDIF